MAVERKDLNGELKRKNNGKRHDSWSTGD